MFFNNNMIFINLNTCPVGVATTDPKKEQALIVEEKKYRVTNYITSLHEGLFNIARHYL